MAETSAVRYHDLLFRIILSLIAAHLIVSFGETESFFQLLLSWDYWRSLCFSFIIAFILVSIVYICTAWLDNRFDWTKRTLPRVWLQISLGLVLPSIIAFLLADVYFRIYHISIFKTIYLKFDYPVVVLMLLLLNVYYVAFHFFRRWQQSVHTVNDRKDGKTERKEHTFIVTKGTRNIPLPVAEIAYWYHEGDYNFVRVFKGEDFVVSETLDSIEKQLNSEIFFRVNRQMIVNIDACLHFEHLAYGKIKVMLKPDFKKDTVISQKKAKDFKAWIRFDK